MFFVFASLELKLKCRSNPSLVPSPMTHCHALMSTGRIDTFLTKARFCFLPLKKSGHHLLSTNIIAMFGPYGTEAVVTKTRGATSTTDLSDNHSRTRLSEHQILKT
jgi:hypothetical protein